MKKISKVQSDCALLYYINTNKHDLKNDTFNGVIIEKSAINITSEFEYTIFINKLRFLGKIKSNKELSLYSKHEFTIHTFIDEANLRKKFRLHLV